MRVLVVEDYDPLRVATAKALREAGHMVDTAPDGEEAIALGRTARYDVILSLIHI